MVSFSSITLRQVLTMSAGFSDEIGGPQLSDAKVASILKLPLEATPGTRFIYSDPGAQLVSAIVIIVSNLIADVFYAIADPRIRYS